MLRNLVLISLGLTSVQFSHSFVSDYLGPHELQHTRSPCPSSHLILSRPLLLLPPIPTTIRVFSNESALHILQHHSFQINPRVDLLQNGLVKSPCSPRNSQESSPTPQFESINSSVISLLHSPTLTSIHNHWKNHSLD